MQITCMRCKTPQGNNSRSNTTKEQADTRLLKDRGGPAETEEQGSTRGRVAGTCRGPANRKAGSGTERQGSGGRDDDVSLKKSDVGRPALSRLNQVGFLGRGWLVLTKSTVSRSVGS